MDIMLPWYVLGIIVALISTLFIIIRKKALENEHAMNFESARTIAVALFTLLLIPFADFNFNIGTIFLVYCASLVAAIGIIFQAKAVRHGEISLMAPLSNIKPAFVVLLAYIFLAEKLSIGQLAGIFTLLIAAYLLQSDHHMTNLLAPLKNLLKDKNAIYYLLATLLFSITALMDKYLITDLIDIYSYTIIMWIFIAINFNFMHGMIFGFKETIDCFKRQKNYTFIVGFLAMAGTIVTYQALSMTKVSLLTPVIMLRTLFVVFVGGTFFKERNIFYRTVVSLFMLGGALMVILL